MIFLDRRMQGNDDSILCTCLLPVHQISQRSEDLHVMSYTQDSKMHTNILAICGKKALTHILSEWYLSKLSSQPPQSPTPAPDPYILTFSLPTHGINIIYQRIQQRQS